MQSSSKQSMRSHLSQCFQKHGAYGAQAQEQEHWTHDPKVGLFLSSFPFRVLQDKVVFLAHVPLVFLKDKPIFFPHSLFLLLFHFVLFLVTKRRQVGTHRAFGKQHPFTEFRGIDLLDSLHHYNGLMHRTNACQDPNKTDGPSN